MKTNNLQAWEIDIISRAFSRCFGLQSALSNAVTKSDKLLKTASLNSLAGQTAMNVNFLETHLTEIINLA